MSDAPDYWLPAISEEQRQPHSCLTCEVAGTIKAVAPMTMLIAVGFGSATVTKGNTLVYDEPHGNEEDSEDDLWTVADAEELAKQDPDHDWRIELNAPLAGRTYQRQGAGNWVLVMQDEGFA